MLSVDVSQERNNEYDQDGTDNKPNNRNLFFHPSTVFYVTTSLAAEPCREATAIPLRLLPGVMAVEGKDNYFSYIKKGRDSFFTKILPGKIFGKINLFAR